VGANAFLLSEHYLSAIVYSLKTEKAVDDWNKAGGLESYKARYAAAAALSVFMKDPLEGHSKKID